jgi:hypothetical protein
MKGVTMSTKSSFFHNLHCPPYTNDNDNPLPKAVLIDLDGTLIVTPPEAKPVSVPYSSTDDWDALVESYSSRKAHPGVLALIKILTVYSDLHIIFMTGRARTMRQETATRKWISENVPTTCLGAYSLYMRAPGDFRIDNEVKKDLTRLCVERYDILLTIDDLPSNLKMWEEHYKIPGFSAV